MLRKFKILSAILIVIALIGAGISPACDFISGKTSLIEICTGNGQVKIIEVAQDQSPEAPAPHHERKHKSCAFCVTASTLKYMTPAVAVFHTPTPTAYLATGAETFTPRSADSKAFEATGPPIFFL